MDISRLLVLLLVVSPLQAACAGGEPRETKAQSEQTAAVQHQGDPVRGKQLFESDFGCNICHGMDATGGIGPNIRQVTIERVYHAVQNFPDMINWQYNYPETFEDQSLLDIVAYLNTLEK